MRVGRSDGMIANMKLDAREGEEVIATGEFDLEDGHLSVEVELEDGNQVWVDVLTPMGGSGAAFVRLPRSGDVGVCVFMSGDYTRGYWLGYAHLEARPVDPDIEAGSMYAVLSGSESFVMRAGGGRIELRTGSDASVTLEGDTVTTSTGSSSVTVTPTSVEADSNGTKATVAASGDFELSNPQGSYARGSAAGFFDCGNVAGGSVVQFIADLVTATSTGVVATAGGPQPLISPLFPELATRGARIKGV